MVCFQKGMYETSEQHRGTTTAGRLEKIREVVVVRGSDPQGSHRDQKRCWLRGKFRIECKQGKKKKKASKQGDNKFQVWLPGGGIKRCWEKLLICRHLLKGKPMGFVS